MKQNKNKKLRKTNFSIVNFLNHFYSFLTKVRYIYHIPLKFQHFEVGCRACCTLFAKQIPFRVT